MYYTNFYSKQCRDDNDKGDLKEKYNQLREEFIVLNATTAYKLVEDAVALW